MARISVVIPCHNNEAHVEAAVASVTTQSCRPAEIIVVDDGSNDGSAAAAAGFGNRVRLIRQPNRGVAAARNAGIAASSGDLLAFLDADDAWPVDSLARRLEAISETDCDLVFGRVRQCLGEPTADAPIAGPEIAGRVAGAMMVRRRAFDRVGGFDERLRSAETMDWVARADDLGIRQARCDTLVLFRRIHEANMTRDRSLLDPNCIATLRRVIERRRTAAR